MTRRRVRTLSAAVVIALGPLAAGCAGTGALPAMTPSASMTTAIQGWEHYFALEWAPESKPSGESIGGYIYNKYGASAVNVQILAQGLDAGGNVVSQKLAWVQGTVPPMNRALFTVPGLAPAPRYRVTVWAFEFVETGSAPQR
jgi:hypothetical protein